MALLRSGHYQRYFRDNVLCATPEGQEIIRLYYEWSAVIVKGMEEDEEFNAGVKDIIKLIISSLSINNSVPLE